MTDPSRIERNKTITVPITFQHWRSLLWKSRKFNKHCPPSHNSLTPLTTPSHLSHLSHPTVPLNVRRASLPFGSEAAPIAPQGKLFLPPLLLLLHPSDPPLADLQ